MNTLCRILGTAMALTAPFAVLAQRPATSLGGIGDTFENTLLFTNNYLVPLFLAIALICFLWGMFKFFVMGGTSEESRGEGKKLLIYSIAGFVLILSLWGIVNALAAGLNFNSKTLQTLPPVPIPN